MTDDGFEKKIRDIAKTLEEVQASLEQYNKALDKAMGQTDKAARPPADALMKDLIVARLTNALRFKAVGPKPVQTSLRFRRSTFEALGQLAKAYNASAGDIAGSLIDLAAEELLTKAGAKAKFLSGFAHPSAGEFSWSLLSGQPDSEE